MTVAHVAVNVGDFEAAKAFYLSVLAPLGYRIVYEEPGALAYLADAHGLDFGIGRRDPVGGAHVAFECDDRAGVDRSTSAHSRPAEATTARPGSVRSTTRTTTPRTSSIRTATTSRPSVTSAADT